MIKQQNKDKYEQKLEFWHLFAAFGSLTLFLSRFMNYISSKSPNFRKKIQYEPYFKGNFSEIEDLHHTKYYHLYVSKNCTEEYINLNQAVSVFLKTFKKCLDEFYIVKLEEERKSNKIDMNSEFILQPTKTRSPVVGTAISNLGISKDLQKDSETGLGSENASRISKLKKRFKNSMAKVGEGIFSSLKTWGSEDKSKSEESDPDTTSQVSEEEAHGFVIVPGPEDEEEEQLDDEPNLEEISNNNSAKTSQKKPNLPKNEQGREFFVSDKYSEDEQRRIRSKYKFFRLWFNLKKETFGVDKKKTNFPNGYSLQYPIPTEESGNSNPNNNDSQMNMVQSSMSLSSESDRMKQLLYFSASGSVFLKFVQEICKCI